MAQQELDLFKISAGFPAELRACPPQIVRAEALHPNLLGRLFDHRPDGPIAQAVTIWHQKIGDCKTEASAKPVPLDGYMAEDLLQWRKKSPYPTQEDWVFASPTMKGEQPYWPDNLMKRYIKPAAQQLGINKNIGWHTFRHSFGTLLKVWRKM